MRRPARHPDHHARVALPDAHLAGSRLLASVETGDRGRDPHAGHHQARGAPGALAGAAAGPVPGATCSASASPPRSARSRKWRATWAAADTVRADTPPGPHRRRARVRKTVDLRVEVPVEDMSRLGEAVRPGADGELPDGPPSSSAALDLAGALPAPAGADPPAPLHHRVRQQPPPGRAPGGRAQRAGRRGALVRAHHGSDRPRAAAPDRGALKAGKPAGDGRHLLAGAGHRHGRRRPGRAGRVARVGRLGPPAHRPGRAPGGGRLARA